MEYFDMSESVRTTSAYILHVHDPQLRCFLPFFGLKFGQLDGKLKCWEIVHDLLTLFDLRNTTRAILGVFSIENGSKDMNGYDRTCLNTLLKYEP